MRIQQHHFSNHKWEAINQQNCDGTFNCCLVLVFGCIDLINSADIYEHLKALYPVADIVFASTAGEIAHDTVYDKSIIATAIEFTDTTIKCASLALTDDRDSYTTGAELMDTLSGDNLAYVFLISDGTKINGSELVAGFNSRNQQNIPVSGGLAGDGDRFQKTYTGLNMVPSEGNVIAVGFYGEHIRIGHGSVGGWDEFGHERTITRSDKNILYEIDN